MRHTGTAVVNLPRHATARRSHGLQTREAGQSAKNARDEMRVYHARWRPTALFKAQNVDRCVQQPFDLRSELTGDDNATHIQTAGCSVNGLLSAANLKTTDLL